MDNQWLHSFETYLASSGKAPNTVKTYSSGLLNFIDYCRKYEITPFDADRPLIRGWINDRLHLVSSAQVNKDLVTLRHFYAWLRETRDREDDPTDGLRVKRTKTLPTKPLSQDDVLRLLGSCGDERDRLLLLVLCSTGARISELASLRAEDIDWARGSIVIRGKGDKERRVEPMPEVMNRLRAFCGMFPTGPIWISVHRKQPLSGQQIRKIIYEIAKRAKVDDVHPHRFRAFFATEYIDQFGDIQALQGVLGHESINTTQLYSVWTREQRGMKQMKTMVALERLIS